MCEGPNKDSIKIIAESMRKTHVLVILPNTEFDKYQIYLAVKGKIQKIVLCISDNSK